MIVPKTLEEINQMIADGVEENISLDYKAADALQNTDGKKKEIAKDVSAMANSAGGVIIYGVKESDDEKRKHLPETITPIDCRTFSKEQLEQIINGNVSPKIEGLLIHPISTGNEFDVVYVVEVPQGDTAHQNTKDRRYYKRQNFISEPMLDHEIRDVMNRSEHPKIELLFEIVKETYETNLEVRPFNIGRVYANYINFLLFLPRNLSKVQVATIIQVTS
ncbi:MAG: Divergent AAA domain protein [Acidobacteria bacterium OLB17]|nr:MAG: Divergent AAA domain protein [Acidobacteria bacterium OLB17]